MSKFEEQVANEMYEMGKAENARALEDIEKVAARERAVGFLQKARIDGSYNQLMECLTLFKIRENKLYEGNWGDFCISQGLVKRTVDAKLADLRPLLEEFRADFAQIFDMPFSKIRYLGKTVGQESAQIEDGAIVVDGLRIPLKSENRDDIEALIDELKKSHKREREAMADQLEANKKLTQNKQKRIDALEREIARMENAAEKEGFEDPTEEAYCRQMTKLRETFRGLSAQIDPDNPVTIPEDATKRMKVDYLTTLKYLKDIAEAAYDTATVKYGKPPGQEEWMQPDDDMTQGDDDFPPVFSDDDTVIPMR